MKKQRTGFLLLLAVCLSIGTGRWGAWIGIPSVNFFVIDFIIFLSLVSSITSLIRPSHLLLAFYLSCYVALNLFMSSGYPVATRLRDLAPFIYLIIFILLRPLILEIDETRMLSWLRGATVFSLFWNLGRSLEILNEFSLSPFTGVPVFSQRPDQFGFVAAIGIISWGLKECRSQKTKLSRNIIMISFLVEVALMPGRAGAIASLLGLAYVVILPGLKNLEVRRFGKKVIVGIFFVLLAGGLASNILPENSSLKRSGIVASEGVSQIGAEGTARARLRAQVLLLNWVDENNLEFFGAGAGREMLLESNAYKWLSGATDVRQPHNWWVSLFSRFGLFGALLWVFATLCFIRPTKEIKAMNLRVFVLISILISATFGVILESPFGLIPFYFFLMRTPKKN
jgi:hypothetical protein